MLRTLALSSCTALTLTSLSRVLTPQSIVALNTNIPLSVNLALAIPIYITNTGVINAAITAAQTRVSVGVLSSLGQLAEGSLRLSNSSSTRSLRLATIRPTLFLLALPTRELSTWLELHATSVSATCTVFMRLELTTFSLARYSMLRHHQELRPVLHSPHAELRLRHSRPTSARASIRSLPQRIDRLLPRQSRLSQGWACGQLGMCRYDQRHRVLRWVPVPSRHGNGRSGLHRDGRGRRGHGERIHLVRWSVLYSDLVIQ